MPFSLPLLVGGEPCSQLLIVTKLLPHKDTYILSTSGQFFYDNGSSFLACKLIF